METLNIRSIVREAITEGLAKRGYTLAPAGGKAEFRVHYQVGIGQKTRAGLRKVLRLTFPDPGRYKDGSIRLGGVHQDRCRHRDSRGPATQATAGADEQDAEELPAEINPSNSPAQAFWGVRLGSGQGRGGVRDSVPLAFAPAPELTVSLFGAAARQTVRRYSRQS